MKEYPTEKIRTVALVSHNGVGKTSLSEAMLYTAGVITRLGKVEDGNTVSDYTPLEIERRGSINLTLMHLEWKDTKINIIDTPGYADFIGEVIAALKVAESVVILVSAQDGVAIGTQLIWERINKGGNIPLIVINKLDVERANYKAAFEDIKQTLTKDAVLLQLPVGEGTAFAGIIDLVKGKYYSYAQGGKKEEAEIPKDFVDAYSSARQELVNDGPPNYAFHDIFSSSGIIYQETHSEPSWGDIDNDGDLDLFITCVYEGRRSFMYRNDGDGRFTDITYETGLCVENGWGAAFCDYDRDGFLDLAVASGGRVNLFRNKGNSNNFVEIRLVGVYSNKAAIGAIVKAYAQELKQIRYVEGGKGTSNQNSLVVHFGLRDKTIIDSLIIIWPCSGNIDKYTDIQANNFYKAEERRGLYITSIDNEHSQNLIPAFEISNLYPNPFNKSFTFEYYIGLPSYVKFELYDVLGRKVCEIFSGFVGAGKGKLSWEPKETGEIRTGLYFLSMKSRNRVISKKLVYLK